MMFTSIFCTEVSGGLQVVLGVVGIRGSGSLGTTCQTSDDNKRLDI